ncbi:MULTISPECIES: class I SAM-dependent DNA methyltransferase [unclassified Roseivivax]|uniref:class I SAM-dependent DNA methyltransferase n=1 Tax=Roseivivax sp. GX 12232 TaxID=2900547 RepID=UPI001E377B97|nr:methyltransferase domain-containing protein [Roseivivax sp. GX 12232]MCE0503837.1 methyltransferase type 11 [Roseivivax sp. GX 12232]
MSEKSYLDRVYEAQSQDERRQIYDVWAKEYDADLAGADYATPGRCAAALARFAPDPGQPLLDVGCGTGLSGAALQEGGFALLDGVDVSGGMLDVARDKGLYRNLTRIAPGAPLPSGYGLMAAIGVIGAGAGPMSILDLMIEALEPGGLLVASFNEKTLAEPEAQAHIDRVRASGLVKEHLAEMGPHVRSKNLQALVVVFEKA